MSYQEIEKLLNTIPEIFNSLTDENFSEKINSLNSIGKEVKTFKNNLFSKNSAYSENEKKIFLDMTKQIRKMFDNTIHDRSAEMEKVSDQIKRLKMMQKVNKYRSG